jgi:hypothetical protein
MPDDDEDSLPSFTSFMKYDGVANTVIPEDINDVTQPPSGHKRRLRSKLRTLSPTSTKIRLGQIDLVSPPVSPVCSLQSTFTQSEAILSIVRAGQS